MNHNTKIASCLKNSVYFLSLIVCLSTFFAEGACKKINASKACIKKLIAGDVYIKGNLTVDKLVSNRIGKTYVVGVDVPTIQAGIDLASSGLKPDSASHEVPLPPGAKNVTLSIPAGKYTETLFIDTNFSDPTINDRGTDIGSLQGRGLRLIGDTRPIAGFTYMLAGQLQADSSFCANDGSQNSLGIYGSTITSMTTIPAGPNNLLTVTTSGSTQPNFADCGIVPGDIIILTDSTGTVYQNTVVSAALNTVTYSGAPVVITDKGAALTFCPNVIVQNSNAAAICYIVGGAVETVGIWFQVNPLIPPTYTVAVELTGALFGSQLLIDDRNNLALGVNLYAHVGGQANAFLADADVVGHISTLGGALAGVFLGQDGWINGSGYFYVMQTGGAYGFLVASNSFSYVASIQVNGAGQTAQGYVVNGTTCVTQDFIGLFNCAQGIVGGFGGQIITPNNSYIYNCPQGVALDLGSRVNNASGFTFTIDTSSTAGVALTGASQFNSEVPVTFVSTPTQFTYDAGSSIQNGPTDSRLNLELPGPFANDAAAAAGGIPLFGLYRLIGAPQTVAVRTV